mmetsp:Transcript_7171/g.28958  ORF Transcript_7171/g.28958 Transcript_7171/m.28958 type:complete len:267 (+) Transcript_7171:786-1586(+)
MVRRFCCVGMIVVAVTDDENAVIDLRTALFGIENAALVEHKRFCVGLDGDANRLLRHSFLELFLISRRYVLEPVDGGDVELKLEFVARELLRGVRVLKFRVNSAVLLHPFERVIHESTVARHVLGRTRHELLFRERHEPASTNLIDALDRARRRKRPARAALSLVLRRRHGAAFDPIDVFQWLDAGILPVRLVFVRIARGSDGLRRVAQLGLVPEHALELLPRRRREGVQSHPMRNLSQNVLGVVLHHKRRVLDENRQSLRVLLSV